MRAHALADAAEVLLLADLDFEQRRRARRWVSYLDDRRPELY